jgi:hypothetical protein
MVIREGQEIVLLASNSRGTRALDHISDVRGTRRISKHRSLEISSRQAVPDREAKDVDDFLRVRPDDVDAQNSIGSILDQGLEPVDRLVLAGAPCTSQALSRS